MDILKEWNFFHDNQSPNNSWKAVFYSFFFYQKWEIF